MSNSLPYFAYGSNMWPEQMLDRCPGSVPLGVATLPDHRFLINERGVATVVPSTGRVVGVLWDVTAAHIDALDGFEGLAVGNYVREQMVVADAGGATSAWIYIACHNQPSAPRPGYLERVVAGAEHFDIDPGYIDEQLRVWTLGGA